MTLREEIEQEASKYDKKYGFSDGFISSIIRIESAYNPDAFRKESRGRYSMGLMQVLRGEGAVDEYEAVHGHREDEWYYDWKNNIKVGAWYLGVKILSYLQKWNHDFTERNYIIAYNAGIGNLNKYHAGMIDLPSYTKVYLEKMFENGINVDAELLKKGSLIGLPFLLLLGGYFFFVSK